MRKTGIQQNVMIPEGKKEVEQFKYNGMTFKVEGYSNKRHLIPSGLPIGVIMTGFTAQYTCVEVNTGLVAEAYIYYYRKHEGGNVAILEAIEY